jgi:hypothetical protein
VPLEEMKQDRSKVRQRRFYTRRRPNQQKVLRNNLMTEPATVARNRLAATRRGRFTDTYQPRWHNRLPRALPAAAWRVSTEDRKRAHMQRLPLVLQSQSLQPALITVLTTIADGCRDIDRQISRGALAGVLGAAGNENVKGVEQK